MRTLDRFLSLIFLRSFVLALASLVTLFLFQGLLGDLLDATYPPEQDIVYQLLNVPQVAVQMMPPAVLLATVLMLSGLSRTNELVACLSIGVGLRRIMALILSLVFMISCLILILEDRILPPTHKARTTYYWHQMRKRPDFSLDIKQDKIWYRSKNLIYNLQLFDAKTKAIHGMTVYTFDENFNLMQVVDASRAEYTPKGWRLLSGTVTVFSATDRFPLTQPFVRKDLIIAETPKDFQEIEKEVDGLRLKELYRYIQRIRAAGADTKSYEVKFHAKVSLAFIPLVMCVLAVPFSARATRREGGLAKDLGICLALTFFYWLFYSVGLSLGTNGALPPWLAAWLPSMIFSAIAAALVVHKH